MSEPAGWKFWFVQSLTLGRIPVILAFGAIHLCVVLPVSAAWFTLGLVLLIVAAVTDLFDGYFARRFDLTSRLGAYADPLADKVYYLVTFPTLVFIAAMTGQSTHARLLLALTVLFLLRDQWVSFMRSIGSMHNVDAKANWSGKARTLISFPVICVIYVHLAAPGADWLRANPWPTYVLEGMAMAINVISIWVYTAYYWPWLKLESQTRDDEQP